MTITKTWGTDAAGAGSSGVGVGWTWIAATGVWLGWTTTAADFEQAVPARSAARATAVHLDKGIGEE
jgi:hypothetical protein